MVDWCHFLECASFLWLKKHGHIYCRVSSPFEVEYCGKVGGPELVGGRQSWILLKSQNLTNEMDSLWNIVKICQLKV